MRRRGLRSPITNHKLQIPQRGYMLITLMLIIALAAMALLAMLPAIGQQIKRDQEEELRHRGNSYIRAIQRFYKKIGRYPTRVEELENTNKIRFLRKRYKDPMSHDPETGKERDFKFLHMQDIHLNNGPMLGMPAGAMGALQGQGGPLGQSGALGQAAGALGQSGLQSVLAQAQQSGGLPTSGPGTPLNNATGEDEPEPGNPQNPQASPNSSSPFSSSSSPGSSGTGSGNNTVFGGGPILGVASTSKAKSIREFDKKNHYNDWLFIYDPTSDRGGLLVGPWQTPSIATLPGLTPAGQQPGAPSQGGLSQPNSGPSGGPSQNPMGPPPQAPEQNSPQQQQ